MTLSSLSPIALCAALGLGLGLGCGPGLAASASQGSSLARDGARWIYPQERDGSRDILKLRQIEPVSETLPMVLLADEFGGVGWHAQRPEVFVGTSEGNMLALDPYDGRIQWERQLGAAPAGLPRFASSELMLVGTDDGYLHAIDLTTHKDRWSYRSEGTIRRPALVAGDTVFFANSRDQVYALDLGSGEWRWQFEREFQEDFTIHGRAGLAYLEREAEIGGESGVLYTGFDGGEVAALGASSGEALWITRLGDPEKEPFVDSDGTPLIDRAAGELIVSTHASGVFGLDLQDGSIRWQRRMKGARSVVRGPGGLLLVGSSLEGIFALEGSRADTLGGEQRWRRQVDPGVLSDPVLLGEGLVAFGHSESGLLVLDARTGELLVAVETGSGISGQPVYDQSRRALWAVSNRGLLLRFDLNQDAV